MILNGIWQFSMNLIQMEDDFLSVWYANRFTECVVSVLLTAFENICFKETDGFHKLIILKCIIIVLDIFHNIKHFNIDTSIHVK